MKTLAAVIATVALAAPAFAGGPTAVAPEPTVAPPPAPIAASTDWSGFYVGGQLGFADIDSNGAGLDGDGLIGGIHGGYRFDFGRFVAGAEIDYDTADVELGDGLGTLDSVTRLKLMAGAELGQSLVYGTAGVAYADATVGGGGLSDNGYFFGAGVDVALDDRWSVGGEVLQHNFDDFDGTTVDLDVTTVKARVSFRF